MDYLTQIYISIVNPAIVSSLLLAVIWFVVAVFIFRLILMYINHSGATGKEFDFGEWLDSVGKSSDAVAKSIVLAAFILGFAFVVGSFIHG